MSFKVLYAHFSALKVYKTNPGQWSEKNLWDFEILSSNPVGFMKLMPTRIEKKMNIAVFKENWELTF